MHNITITQHAIDRFHERFPDLNLDLRKSIKNAVTYGATTERTLNLLDTEHNIVFVIEKPQLIAKTILTLDLYIANLQSAFNVNFNIPHKTIQQNPIELARDYFKNNLHPHSNTQQTIKLTDEQYKEFLKEYNSLESKSIKKLVLFYAKKTYNLQSTKELKQEINLTKKQFSKFWVEYDNYIKIVIVKELAIAYAKERNMEIIPWSKEMDKLVAKKFNISTNKMLHFWGEYNAFIQERI